MSALIETRGITKRFRARHGTTLTAVNDLSCTIAAGETVGLIGESGSGKSTLGRLILGLIPPDEGEVLFEGISLSQRSKAELSRLRAQMQVVFQEPYASLNPRLRVRSIIAEPLIVQGAPADERSRLVAEVMERVELADDLADRYPVQLSGGQQQRVGIARAVVGKPRLVVLDEPTASLDRTVRRNIADLLLKLQADLGLSYLLITHDIGSVRRMAARSLVMFKGSLIEAGPTSEILSQPGHPYTKALVTSELVPKLGARQERYLLRPRPPGPTAPAPGCPLAPVCPLVIDECNEQMPPLLQIGEDHRAACIRWQDVSAPCPSSARSAVTAAGDRHPGTSGVESVR